MGFFDFFPYTNFHNVNLDWVLQRVKEWGELVEANNTAFHNLEEANASFKRYVEKYLENLDVQAQIDDKLDRMFESGELTDYLQPYVSDTVTDWLEENITEPTGVIIDSSLTVSGACADAKATGDRFKSINNDLFSLNAKTALMALLYKINAFIDDDGLVLYDELYDALFEQLTYGILIGYGLSNVTGEPFANDARLCSDFIRINNPVFSAEISNPNIWIGFRGYDNNKTYLGSDPQYSIGTMGNNSVSGTFGDDVKYVRMTAKKSDNSVVTENDILGFTLTVNGAVGRMEII